MPGSDRAADGTFDVVVIGAGAAGMMCAAVAGRRGRRVLLVEHYDVVGEKIRISGGGRCNFTNTQAGPANYLSQNPDFCRGALARYTPAHFIALVERYGIGHHEKKLGQRFCDNSSLDIIEMLKTECAHAGVQWAMPCSVQRVTRAGAEFRVATSQGDARSGSLVIVSAPVCGSTSKRARITILPSSSGPAAPCVTIARPKGAPSYPAVR